MNWTAIWGPDYEELAAQAKRLGWHGAGSFWGLCDFAGLPDRLGYPCAGQNRTQDIQIVSAAIRSRLDKMHAAQQRRREEKLRTYKHAAAWVTLLLLIGAALLGAASLLTLSGCLTASKIHRWESALLGWSKKGKPECVDAAKVASKYLVNANQRLQGATGATDVQLDQEAKKLMTEAAQKCGEVVP